MINQIVEKFIKNPAYLENGAGLLSKTWNCSKDDIYKAKQIARNKINIQKPSIDIKVPTITGNETNFEEGSKQVKLESPSPLTPSEIEKLVGVDGITTYVARVWDKLLPSGTWTYSVDIRYRVKEFYSSEELNKKIKSIFSNTSPEKLPKPISVKEEALFIYIGDDHCGNILKDSLFDKKYNESIYNERLQSILQEIVNLDKKFEKIVIVNLGDELDGWNGKTTRYDHDLGSASNKEQFDIFVNARKRFYDELFNSKLANQYVVYTLNNSNHTGLGLSYIASKTLEMYLSAKYPEVQCLNQNKFIDYMVYGNHIFGFTHGKDEKFMKSPFPLNLDHKTDLWLYDYYSKNIDNPTEAWISTIKADIHKYNVNIGKSGRYVNVPSISSGSNWIEHNFGDSSPGVLLEIVNPSSKNIISIPLYF